MIEKINKWLPLVNTIAIVALFVMVLVGGNQPVEFGGGTRMINGLSTDSTSPSTGEVRTTSLTVTATSTVRKSYDGFVAEKDATLATSTAATSRITVFTATGPTMCRGGGVIMDATGFGPAFNYSIGTTTAALSASSLILLASTTAATSTDTMTSVTFTGTHYLATGEKIVLQFGDYMIDASSTSYGNWDIEADIPCWLMGSNN